MSKFTKAFREDSITELMSFIRRNTQNSPCIETYKNLLNEINDKKFVMTAVSDMNSFATEIMTLFKDVDRVKCNKYQSKMLRDSFIRPERFFKDSLKMTNEYICLNAAMNYKFGGDTKFTIGQKNRLGEVWKKQQFEEKDEKKVDEILTEFHVTRDNPDKREECRKIVLCWQYMPAIVKAIIQTKRRSLKLDQNSKKFD